jgi:DNA-binding response OmpR family regulator
MKILLVDDEPMTLTALSKKLSDKGYNVSAVDNSFDALKVIDEQKIDLIISDIVMPSMSGFTLLTMLKSFYFLTIPIILISSFSQENVLLRSNSLGAAEFVSKPINYDELFFKIEKYNSSHTGL